MKSILKVSHFDKKFFSCCYSFGNVGSHHIVDRYETETALVLVFDDDDYKEEFVEYIVSRI